MGKPLEFYPEPDTLYDDEYHRLTRRIPYDFATYGQDVIDQLCKEDHNPDACHLLELTNGANYPELVLTAAHNGAYGEGELDVLKLAIEAVAHWRATTYAQGFWPTWQP